MVRYRQLFVNPDGSFLLGIIVKCYVYVNAATSQRTGNNAPNFIFQTVKMLWHTDNNFVVSVIYRFDFCYYAMAGIDIFTPAKTCHAFEHRTAHHPLRLLLLAAVYYFILLMRINFSFLPLIPFFIKNENRCP